MTFDFSEYQRQLSDIQKGYKNYHDDDPTMRLVTLVLGLSGESGEVTELFKKHLRDGTEMNPYDLAKELGDILAYITLVGQHFGLALDTIALVNLDKLTNREANGTLHGSGNDR
jgi:NTP pyrophosphatase (non-canonical NTP hydrolase)